MAAKKSVRKKTVARKATRKTVARKTTRVAATRKKTAARKTAASKKPPARATAPRKKVVPRPRPTGRPTSAAARRTMALGRPRVPGTAELELMFQKDLEARQVFAFLRVKTLKELEELSAEEILERLTAPMERTVARIRKALAMNNRCLAGDQKFAVDFKKQLT